MNCPNRFAASLLEALIHFTSQIGPTLKPKFIQSPQKLVWCTRCLLKLLCHSALFVQYTLEKIPAPTTNHYGTPHFSMELTKI